jgi:hypothetical protein
MSLHHRAVPMTSKLVRRGIAGAALLALAPIASTLSAQATGAAFEVRPFVGAFIPTGDQRDLLKDAVVVGGQASWRLVPALALTGTFAWSPSKDRLTAGNQTLDIYQYDIGAELRTPSAYDAGIVDFTPFVGLGLGGRTYSYRNLDVDSKTNFDGYGAIGGDIGFGPLALRIEGRDYVSQFKPLTGTGSTKTRNDIGLAAGVAYRF